MLITSNLSLCNGIFINCLRSLKLGVVWERFERPTHCSLNAICCGSIFQNTEIWTIVNSGSDCVLCTLGTGPLHEIEYFDIPTVKKITFKVHLMANPLPVRGNNVQYKTDSLTQISLCQTDISYGNILHNYYEDNNNNDSSSSNNNNNWILLLLLFFLLLLLSLLLLDWPHNKILNTF